MALHFGVSHETLRRAVRLEGIVMPLRPVAPMRPLRHERAYRLPGWGRSRTIAPEELTDLVDWHHQGESMHSLARSVGVSHEIMRPTLAATTGGGNAEVPVNIRSGRNSVT